MTIQVMVFYNCEIFSGRSNSLRSCKVCCNFCEVWYGSEASWLRFSKPRLASLRSVVVANNEVEDLKPVRGYGMISVGDEIRLFLVVGWQTHT